MYRINCKYPQMYSQMNMQEDMIDKTCDNVSGCCDVDECACGFEEEVFPACPVYGQCYVPNQRLNDVFKPCSGLDAGTIFPELVSPYIAGQSMMENEYLKSRRMEECGCGRYE